MYLRDKKLLVSTHTYPNYMPVPRYSDQMVVVGPRYPNRRRADGRVASFCTPAFEPYALDYAIEALPAEQKPEIVFVRVDASHANQPIGLENIDVPKVLIIGDTHHLDQPLRKMLHYAITQRFDHVVLDHTPQHAHWFQKAGISELHWIPGFLLPGNLTPPQREPDLGATFVGSTGGVHVYRTQLIEYLAGTDVDLQVTSCPPKQTRSIYNRSRVSLNVSLNGDFNLRNFEVLLAGGLLVTDRLSEYACFNRLFEPGKHCVVYDNETELEDQIRHLVADAAENWRIRHLGAKHVAKHHSMPARSMKFYELVAGREVPDARIDDPRNRAYGVDSREDFWFKVAAYELAQEVHRRRPFAEAVFSPGADKRMLCDVLDLPRLRPVVARLDEIEAFSGLPGASSVAERAPAACFEDLAGLLYLTSEEIGSLDYPTPLALVVTDWLRLGPPERVEVIDRVAARYPELVQRGDGLFVDPAEDWRTH